MSSFTDVNACSSLEELADIVGKAQPSPGKRGRYSVKGMQGTFSLEDVEKKLAFFCSQERIDKKKLDELYKHLCKMSPEIEDNPQLRSIIQKILPTASSPAEQSEKLLLDVDESPQPGGAKKVRATSLMDRETAARLKRFYDKGFHFFVFFNEKRECMFIERTGDRYVYGNLSSSKRPHPVLFSEKLRILLGTNPNEVNELINRSIEGKTTCSRAVDLPGKRVITCERQSNGGFIVKEKFIPSSRVCMIGKRDIVLTPTTNFFTVTVKVMDKDGSPAYVKFRNIEAKLLSEIRGEEDYKPEDWFVFGTGDSALCIARTEISSYSLRTIAPEREGEAKKRLEELARPETEVNYLSMVEDPALLEIFARTFPLATDSSAMSSEEKFKTLSEEFKITCVMDPEGNLLPVFSEIKIISEGSFKKVKEAFALLRDVHGRIAHLAVAKHHGDVDIEELLREVPFSKKLRDAGVPYILGIRAVKRANSGKVGLMMEFCDGGDLYRYTENHFDRNTGWVLPEFREQHKQFVIQVAEGLSGMHEQGIVHSDIKKKNVLLIKGSSGALEVRISDFGLAGERGDVSCDIPGTYPPPEEKEKLEKQKVAKVDEGFQVTDKIDEWAFGLLMLDMVYEGQKKPKMDHRFPSQAIRQGAKEIISILRQQQPQDPIYGIIIDLLQPADKRISVRDTLQRLLATQTKARERGMDDGSSPPFAPPIIA